MLFIIKFENQLINIVVSRARPGRPRIDMICKLAATTTKRSISTQFYPRRAQLGLDGNLRSELEAMHAKWFKAFDSGGRFSLVSHHQVDERE